MNGLFDFQNLSKQWIKMTGIIDFLFNLVSSFENLTKQSTLQSF